MRSLSRVYNSSEPIIVNDAMIRHFYSAHDQRSLNNTTNICVLFIETIFSLANHA